MVIYINFCAVQRKIRELSPPHFPRQNYAHVSSWGTIRIYSKSKMSEHATNVWSFNIELAYPISMEHLQNLDCFRLKYLSATFTCIPSGHKTSFEGIFVPFCADSLGDVYLPISRMDDRVFCHVHTP